MWPKHLNCWLHRFSSPQVMTIFIFTSFKKTGLPNVDVGLDVRYSQVMYPPCLYAMNTVTYWHYLIYKETVESPVRKYQSIGCLLNTCLILIILHYVGHVTVFFISLFVSYFDCLLFVKLDTQIDCGQRSKYH